MAVYKPTLPEIVRRDDLTKLNVLLGLQVDNYPNDGAIADWRR